MAKPDFRHKRLIDRAIPIKPYLKKTKEKYWSRSDIALLRMDTELPELQNTDKPAYTSICTPKIDLSKQDILRMEYAGWGYIQTYGVDGTFVAGKLQKFWRKYDGGEKCEAIKPYVDYLKRFRRGRQFCQAEDIKFPPQAYPLEVRSLYLKSKEP